MPRRGRARSCAYESWLETGEQRSSTRFAPTTAEDCRSTAALRDWLLDAMRPEVAARLAPTSTRSSPPAAKEPATSRTSWPACGRGSTPACSTEFPRRARRRRRRPAERRLLGHLLLFHYREAKPQCWHCFAMMDLTADDLIDEREAIGAARARTGVPRRSPRPSIDTSGRFTVPAPGVQARPSRSACRPGRPGKSRKVQSNRTTTAWSSSAARPRRAAGGQRARSRGVAARGGKVREAATEVARAVLEARTVSRPCEPFCAASAPRSTPRPSRARSTTWSARPSLSTLVPRRCRVRLARARPIALRHGGRGDEGRPPRCGHGELPRRDPEPPARGRGTALGRPASCFRRCLQRRGIRVPPRPRRPRSTTNRTTFGDFAARRRAPRGCWPARSTGRRFDLLFIDEAGQFSLANALALAPWPRAWSCSATRNSCRRSPRPTIPTAPAPRCSSTSRRPHTSPTDRGVLLDATLAHAP